MFRIGGREVGGENVARPERKRKASGVSHYGTELGILIAVAILYFVMTCGGVAI